MENINNQSSAAQKNDSNHMRTFVIVNSDGTESGQFTGHSPRQAALKAINGMGTKLAPAVIRLRERGTKKIHIFKGYTEKIKTPEMLLPFMKTPMIHKSFVTKIGIEDVIAKVI